MSEPMEMELRPALEALGEDHTVWQHSIEELMNDLYDIPGATVRQPNRSQQVIAKKGVVQDLIVLPGTTGVLWAIVRAMKLWLSRDRRRSIEVTVSRLGSEPFTVRASGDNLSLQAFENTIKDALGYVTDPADPGHL